MDPELLLQETLSVRDRQRGIQNREKKTIEDRDNKQDNTRDIRIQEHRDLDNSTCEHWVHSSKSIERLDLDIWNITNNNKKTKTQKKTLFI